MRFRNGCFFVNTLWLPRTGVGHNDSNDYPDADANSHTDTYANSGAQC